MPDFKRIIFPKVSFPQIEKITRDASLTHFFLMFGYKVFSLYFPLYLVANNFSIKEVGYTNFLIYLPMALFAPVVGFLNHRINPTILAFIGIAGYGIYALGMIWFPNLFIFYIFQIILGISASLFFVSSRAILMGSRLENPDRAFAWFYSAPSYADAIAPAIGALFIWKFNFIGVFILSLVIQFATSIFCLLKMRKQTAYLTEEIKIKESGLNYLKVFKKMKEKAIGFPMINVFSVLILMGFSNSFFVLFLKYLGWSQNNILVFNSVLSLVFLPVSIWVIKQVAKFKSEENIARGVQISGVFSILLGACASILNFYSVFVITIGQYAGNLMAFAGKSGLFNNKMKQYPEESAAVDTIFSPFATALGSIFGGLLIALIGYPLIFIGAGFFIFGGGFLGGILAKR